MAIASYTMEEIRRKAENNIQMQSATAEKQKAYDGYQNTYRNETIKKAQAGIGLLRPNEWKKSIYDQHAKPKFNQDDYLKNNQNQVNSIYDQQKNAQMLQFNAERDKAMGLINQQKAEVAPQYASKRNQTDVVNAQNVSKLREVMAANGLQASGENVTANVGLQSARQGALSQLNLQEQQTNNDFNRQITDVNNPDRINAMIAQLESQRSQAMLEASNRADEIGYGRGRDSIMDNRYVDEMGYNRGQDAKQWDYQTGRDAVGDKRYENETSYNQGQDKQKWNYQAGRDQVGDNQWQQQYDYQKGRDGVGDSQWDKQFDAGRSDVATDQAWRTYQFNNMSSSDKAQMAQNASQFGEEMAWKMYSQEYQGELAKSMSDSELEAYRNGNFSGGTGGGPGGPQDVGLGTLSQKYESSGNPATIARTKGDLGGASYGSYQLTTSSGHAQTFANSFGGALKGKKAGTGAFDAAWKAEASKNPKAFAQAQHNYIEKNHYAPAASRFQSTTGINLSSMPKAVKDMIWSIGVQHGAGGAAKIFKNSGVRQGMNAASIIKAVYNERMNVNRYFSSSPSSIKNSVLSRFKRELSDALNMLK